RRSTRRAFRDSSASRTRRNTARRIIRSRTHLTRRTRTIWCRGRRCWRSGRTTWRNCRRCCRASRPKRTRHRRTEAAGRSERMRAVVQRVSQARVVVDGRVTGEIAAGVMVLLGVSRTDAAGTAPGFAEKVAHLRIFDDEQGKMNRSLIETGGAALVVSQFTLYGDARGGRRPSYIEGGAPGAAQARSVACCASE